MKRGIVLAGIVIAILSAAVGYWAGHRATTEAVMPVAAKQERKLLYYRNPMGLPDTSPTPKKDPMGMDYIPVYEGEEGAESTSANQIKLSTEKVQKLGVRTEAASKRVLDKVVRAAGRVEADERRQYAIAPKFEGYVERLFVNTTGQVVGKGQPLFEVYSPELASAQREYAIAQQGAQAMEQAGGDASGMQQLADAALLRLRNWDISDEQIKALVTSNGGKDSGKRTLIFRSPVPGVVTEKKALQGMRFMPGETLYQIADLSSVWVVADVFEQDIGAVTPGVKARVRINAYPDKSFEGTIAYVYPTLTARTRTVPVRVELPNPGMLLKPGMFAQVELPVAAAREVVTVPASAVIDSGTRQIVLVRLGEGRFEPREVKLGMRGDRYVEVMEGVKEGEPVVVAANFLIDAESNLKAALGGMGQDGQASGGAANVGHKASGTVQAIDAKAGTVNIAHDPIDSLQWPAMTMDFSVANASLLHGLKPGDAIAFEIVERGEGEWVITAIKPVTAGHGH